ncbi:hypothetical protein [Lentzea waywayandensis]|nr:hypothetical protein [Lentzea waywayandensis]
MRVGDDGTEHPRRQRRTQPDIDLGDGEAVLVERPRTTRCT